MPNAVTKESNETHGKIKSVKNQQSLFVGMVGCHTVDAK
jgi:hypothetical protein